jgi:dolichol-phosphate mannosyltransferase
VKPLVIIPTYNERENIVQMLRAVMQVPGTFDVLVVDDNSPDGTAELVRVEALAFPSRIHLLERPGKAGLGSAYVAGFKWGLEAGYEVLIEMDADFSHNPADLPRLADPVLRGEADIAIGSRYLTGVNVVNWPMGRVLLSYFANRYVRAISGMPIFDATAGFKAFHRRVLQLILTEPLRFTGYAFQIELKYKSWKYGFRLVEVPIVFTERAAGQSKMTQGIVREAAFGVLSMVIASAFRRWHRPEESASEVRTSAPAYLNS